ncbi:hypothetical protein Trydic_g22352 [Trypoxylus dichotomus]
MILRKDCDKGPVHLSRHAVKLYETAKDLRLQVGELLRRSSVGNEKKGVCMATPVVSPLTPTYLGRRGDVGKGRVEGEGDIVEMKAARGGGCKTGFDRLRLWRNSYKRRLGRRNKKLNIWVEKRTNEKN